MTNFPLPRDNQPLRPCGRCTVCCTSLEIPELEKPMFTVCPRVHPKKGCSRYDERPTSCRQFNCIWKKGLGSIKARPDKSGVVFMPTPFGSGLVAVIHPDRYDDWRQGEAKEIVDWHVSRGIPVFVMKQDKREAIMPTATHLSQKELDKLKQAFLNDRR